MILNILLGDPHERQFKIRENIQILSEKPAFNNLKEGIYINAVKVKKLLYVFVHLVGPLSYFIISTVWGTFFTTKSTFENISDSLSVMAIYHVFMSLLWFFYLDRLDKDINQITKEINDNKM